ncbi:MAG TPA: sigma-70 family RNA polymerase sigma factor [Anaeromyxobacter sp.]|nr:sigma-70 family RNA polymerase sigma factor [Anaeromyxobacter sp.]
MTVPSDRALAERFTRHGDEGAFRELYRRHVDRVHRLAARILGPRGDLDDTVQEIFVQVHRSLDRFRGDSRFATWLHRLAVNVTAGVLRRALREPLEPALRAPDADPGEQLEAREEVLALYRALDELPERNRVAFVLFELEGMPLEEIAETTGVPLQAAAARLRRARLAVARALGRGRVARGAAGAADEEKA